MYINEYGDKNCPTIILLAPMMVSGEDLYNLMSPYFKSEYHIIAPDQGGHGKAGAYISADDEYRQLKEFLVASGCRHIDLLYGASLGVAVAYRLFFDKNFEIAHAWFDGVAFSENAGFAEWFMGRLFKKRKKSLARKPVEASPSLIKMYGYDFAKMMTKNFGRMSDEDIKAICHACCHYKLRKLTDEEQKKLHLDFGEKDFDLRYSQKTIPLYMPKAELVIREDHAHCGYMAAHPKKYVTELEQFLSK
jgi:hypothetical protein